MQLAKMIAKVFNMSISLFVNLPAFYAVVAMPAL